jgi:hypothetical protein
VVEGPSAERPGQESGKADRPGYTRDVSARELLEMELPEPKWAVEGLIPEGLTVLAGKPKLGKSWLALLLALAVAKGKKVLDRQVEEGDVLYLAREDNPRRMQKRLKKLLSNEAGPGKLHIRFDWPRQDKGGLAKLEQWLKDHPGTRVVVIDTWQKFKAAGSSRKNAYEQGYDTAAPVQELAMKYGVAILLIHHTRKPPAGRQDSAGDFLDEISGDYGLIGTIDGGLVLKRARCETDAVLCVTGREVEEEKELALKWDKATCQWSCVGDAEEVQRSQQRREVIQTLQAAGRPLSPRQVATELGRNRDAIKKLLQRMHNDSEIDRNGSGRYFPKGAAWGNGTANAEEGAD